MNTDWSTWLLLGLAAAAGIETVIKGARMIVSAIAPRTKTTVDDDLAVMLGRVDDALTSAIAAVRGASGKGGAP